MSLSFKTFGGLCTRAEPSAIVIRHHLISRVHATDVQLTTYQTNQFCFHSASHLVSTSNSSWFCDIQCTFSRRSSTNSVPVPSNDPQLQIPLPTQRTQIFPLDQWITPIFTHSQAPYRLKPNSHITNISAPIFTIHSSKYSSTTNQSTAFCFPLCFPVLRWYGLVV